MDAMNYDLTLPADYDMDIVRHRVATRGPGTDAFPGLGMKSYGIREKGVDGSPVNEYALFYLWADSAGLKEFLFGAGFASLSDAFGRPSVRHWSGVGFTPGPARQEVPRAATRLATPLTADVPLPEAIDEAVKDLQQYSTMPGVHTAALAVDLSSWELMRFTAWAQKPPAGHGIRYQVLHTSSPHLDELSPGRQW
jgi:uncharacterized protein DUF4865